MAKKITTAMYTKFDKLITHRTITNKVNMLVDFIIQSNDDELIDEAIDALRVYCITSTDISKSLIDDGTDKETEN